MITTEKKIYTLEDYQLLDEGEPYQLINRELIMSPAPSSRHQEISGDIYYQIRHFLIENPIGKVYSAPIDVHFDEHNVYQPDIIFVSNERKNIIRIDGVYGAPDLVIEILSPFSGYYDSNPKKKIYEKFGVNEYWIIDPPDSEVIGFENLDCEFIEIFKGNDKFFSKLLKLEILLKL